MEQCLFCKIVDGKIPAEIVYRDDSVVAFKDINPQAPVHVLDIPVKHVAKLTDPAASDGKMLSQIFATIAPDWQANWASKRLPGRGQLR